MNNKKIAIPLLLILPLMLAVTSVVLNNAKGPYWLGTNLDPEYVYLLNSVNLANFSGVGHIDHPGTPVQVMGAVVLRAVHLFQPSTAGDFTTDVLKRPEMYLSAVNTVMVVLNALIVFLLGWVVYRFARNFYAALWFQAAPFFSITMLHYGLTRVTPEPLLFFSGLAMVAAAVYFLYREDKERPIWHDLVMFGLIAGFGIANKITFFPVVLIPLVLLPRIKAKMTYVAASIAAFVLFTLPIIRMYPRFFQWIINMFTHSGRYGSGPSGLVSTHKYIGNIIALLGACPLFTISLIAALVVLALCFVVPKLRAAARKERELKLLAAVTVSQVIGLLMVAKHSAPHYLLPVLTLSGLSLYLSARLVFALFKSLSIPVQYYFVPVVLVGLAVIWTSFPLSQIHKRVNRLERMKTKQMDIHRHMQTNYKDYGKIYYYAASSPEYALKFGCDISRSSTADALDSLYPGVYFYDIWTNRFARFHINRPIPFSSITAQHPGKIVVQGSRGVKIKGFTSRLLYGKGFLERIFMIK